MPLPDNEPSRLIFERGLEDFRKRFGSRERIIAPREIGECIPNQIFSFTDSSYVTALGHSYEEALAKAEYHKFMDAFTIFRGPVSAAHYRMSQNLHVCSSLWNIDYAAAPSDNATAERDPMMQFACDTPVISLSRRRAKRSRKSKTPLDSSDNVYEHVVEHTDKTPEPVVPLEVPFRRIVKPSQSMALPPRHPLPLFIAGANSPASTRSTSSEQTIDLVSSDTESDDDGYSSLEAVIPYRSATPPRSPCAPTDLPATTTTSSSSLSDESANAKADDQSANAQSIAMDDDYSEDLFTEDDSDFDGIDPHVVLGKAPHRCSIPRFAKRVTRSTSYSLSPDYFDFAATEELPADVDTEQATTTTNGAGDPPSDWSLPVDDHALDIEEPLATTAQSPRAEPEAPTTTPDYTSTIIDAIHKQDNIVVDKNTSLRQIALKLAEENERRAFNGEPVVEVLGRGTVIPTEQPEDDTSSHMTTEELGEELECGTRPTGQPVDDILPSAFEVELERDTVPTEQPEDDVVPSAAMVMGEVEGLKSLLDTVMEMMGQERARNRREARLLRLELQQERDNYMRLFTEHLARDTMPRVPRPLFNAIMDSLDDDQVDTELIECGTAPAGPKNDIAPPTPMATEEPEAPAPVPVDEPHAPDVMAVAPDDQQDLANESNVLAHPLSPQSDAASEDRDHTCTPSTSVHKTSKPGHLPASKSIRRSRHTLHWQEQRAVTTIFRKIREANTKWGVHMELTIKMDQYPNAVTYSTPSFATNTRGIDTDQLNDAELQSFIVNKNIGVIDAILDRAA